MALKIENSLPLDSEARGCLRRGRSRFSKLAHPMPPLLRGRRGQEVAEEMGGRGSDHRAMECDEDATSGVRIRVKRKSNKFMSGPSFVTKMKPNGSTVETATYNSWR